MDEKFRERTFSEERARYTPRVPPILFDVRHLALHQRRLATVDWACAQFFCEPFSSQREVYSFERAKQESSETVPKKVGVFFSGGQAPGGHAVLSGLIDALQEYHPSSRLIGFIGGPKGLFNDNFREITRSEALSIRHTGGFDFLGSGRDTFEGEQSLEAAYAIVEKHQLDGLVIIGGDDSNTNALYLADYFVKKGSRCSIVGVPKTIDGDLRAKELSITFGFDTATKTYSEIIGNIAKDTLSAQKNYFFIRLMGRHTSHITLECALKTHPNLALISEEIWKEKKNLKEVVDQICELIEERIKIGKFYGVIVIPEGLIEHMPDVKALIDELNGILSSNHEIISIPDVEERYSKILSLLRTESRETLLQFPRSLGLQLVSDRDPHGNVIVSKIETEKVLATLVENCLVSRTKNDGKKRPFSFQTFFCGYEGRAQYPTNFDIDYATSLGRVAACAVIHSLNGYLVAINHLEKEFAFWEPYCIPLLSLAVLEVRHGKERPVIRKAPVDLHSKPFHEFSKKRRSWRVIDDYQQTGPIQYWSPIAFFEKPLLLSSDFD